MTSVIRVDPPGRYARGSGGSAMSHACSCGCGHGGGSRLTLTLPGPTAEMTVEQVKSRPGALEVLERFGLNHCCGAHLTLRESAASAGVRVEDVLEALAQAGARA